MHPIIGLDFLLKIYGDDGPSLCLPLHVSAGSAPFDPCLLDALGVVTDECCKDEVGGCLSAELTFVVVEVYCHSWDMLILSVKGSV